MFSIIKELTDNFIYFQLLMMHSVARTSIPWKLLSQIDNTITKNIIDDENVKSHKIVVPHQKETQDGGRVEEFLITEYNMFSSLFELRKVSLPTIEGSCFDQLGVFALRDFDANHVLRGLSGFLSLISDADLVEDYNDFSYIKSNYQKKHGFF